MPFFERDGLRLAYRDDGGGPPLVFQHGLGGDATQPASQAPSGFRVVTLECRGHGASPLGPAAALGFATFAEDLEALMDALALPPSIVGGISMGAGVALALACRRPERVRALVLVRPAWLDRGQPPNLVPYGEIATLLRRYGPETGRQRFMATSQWYRNAKPALARSLTGQFERPGSGECAAVLERLPPDHPIGAEDWEQIASPALVLGARDDAVHPFEMAIELVERLPHGRLREVPSKEAGEAAHREAVATAIAEFSTDLAQVGA